MVKQPIKLVGSPATSAWLNDAVFVPQPTGTVDRLSLGIVGGGVATFLFSLGAHVLRDFSFHQLERYCRARGRISFFDTVLDRYTRYGQAVESLRLVTIAATMAALGMWIFHVHLIEAVSVWWLTAVLAATVLVFLTITHWLPEQIARHASAPVLWWTWWLWQGIATAAAPILWVTALFDFLGRRLSGHTVQEAEDIEEEALEEDILSVVTAGTRDGLLEQDTRDMIESVLELDDVACSAIMTRRSDIDALEVGTPLPEVVRFVNRVGRTRVPVYQETLDHIVGILYAKDLIGFLDPQGPSDPATFSLEAIVRPAWQVVQTKPIDELLREFRGTRSHLAIVVDEFETTVGIVSIEDVLEEIVGEIQDESDLDEDEEIVHVDDDVVVVPGEMHVEELNEQLGLALPVDGPYDSVGGLITVQLGEIPTNSQAITVGNVRLVVVQASARRVERVRIELLDGETARPDGGRPPEVPPPPTVEADDAQASR